MKEKLKYNFLYIISLHILNFITVSYYVPFKVVACFVISSDQTGAPQNHFVRGQILKKAPYILKKALFKKKSFTELSFRILCSAKI